MKIRFFLAAALSGTLLLTGCTTRDDDGPPPPRGERAKKSKKPAKRSGRRDPVEDMFFGLGKRDGTPDFAASDLDKRERDALRESRKWQDEEMRELRSRHDGFNEERRKRKRWVYGLKPED